MRQVRRSVRKQKRKGWLLPVSIVGAVLLIAGGIVALRGIAGGGSILDGTTAETYSVQEVAYGDDGLGGALLGVIEKKYKVSVVASPAIGAATISNSAYVAEGESLALSTTGNTGYTFEGWYEGDTLLSSRSTYTLAGTTSDRTITAKFKLTTYKVTAEAVIGVGDWQGDPNYNYGSYTSGGGYVTGGGLAYSGEEIVLTAVPNDGYRFVGWIDYDSSRVKTELSNPRTITVETTDADYKAVFVRSTGTITVSMIPAAGQVAVVSGNMNDATTLAYDSDYKGQATISSFSSGDYTLFAQVPSTRDLDYTTSSNTHDRTPRYSVDRVYRVLDDGSLELVHEWQSDYTSGYYTSNKWTVSCTDTSENYNYVFILDAYNASDRASYAAIGKVYPEGAGTITGGGSSTLAASYTLSATPTEGYEFDHWEWGSGGTTYTSTENPLSAYPKGYEYYTAYFAKKTVDVSVANVYPEGTLEVLSGTGTLAIDSLTGVTDVSIKCKPLDGYRISKWTTTSGNTTTDHGDSVTTSGGYTYLNFTADDDTKVSVTLEQTAYRISASADPVGNGNIVTMSGEGTPAGDLSTSTSVASVSKLVDDGTIINLKAEAGDGYTFKQWVGSDGSIDSSGTTKAVVVSKDISYTAQFEKKEYTIGFEVDSANPHGSVSLSVDGGVTTTASPQQIAAGSKVTITATPDANYTFGYWTNKAGEKIKDATITINSLNFDDSFTAHFADAQNMVTVKIYPEGGGIVSSGSISGAGIIVPSIAYNDSISVSATPNTGYTFERWEDENGNIYTTNPLQIVNITKDMTFIAVFNTEKSGVTVVASPASGGKVTKTVSDDGKSAELKAVANAGYKFVNWQKDGVVVSTSATYTANDMTDGTVYTATFTGGSLSDVKDAKLSITSESYYKDKRQTTTPDYSVTRDSMTSNAHSTIASEKATQYADSTPDLKNYQAVNNAKSMYDDIEVKDDKSALNSSSELVTTGGEILSVTALDSSDTEDELAASYVDSKFGDRYSYEILACKKVRTPEDYTDGARTLIWKNQGVSEGDNILIIVEAPGSKADWVSAVVDEGDSLRFSLDSIENGCIMTIIKVTIN